MHACVHADAYADRDTVADRDGDSRPNRDVNFYACSSAGLTVSLTL